MTGLDAQGPNAEQIQYWNDQAGPRWVAVQALSDRLLAPLGRRVMERAALTGGERVLDVGCGCGDTAIELARRVGPTGSVVGVDISTVMLARAREQTRALDVHNVTFENADAQTHQFPAATFDVVFSRFGVMFFAQPEVAFSNLAAALRPGGRLAFVCWRAMQDNLWMVIPVMTVAQHIPLPAPPPPDAPGPFSFSAPERVRAILASAGFHDVAFEELNEMLGIADGGIDRAIDLLLQIGPTASLLREASASTRAAVVADLRTALASFDTAAGVRMPSAAWIVTAQRP